MDRFFRIESEGQDGNVRTDILVKVLVGYDSGKDEEHMVMEIEVGIQKNTTIASRLQYGMWETIFVGVAAK